MGGARHEHSMSRGSSRSGSNTGQIVTLVVVLLVVVAAVALLQRTLSNAREINNTASSIAENGRGINLSTDSIVTLDRTDQLGQSIRATADPLVGQLDTIVGLAGTISSKADSITNSALAINSSAVTINGSGASINNSAGGINGQLGEILGLAGSISEGVAQINRNVSDTIGIGRSVLTDADNILVQANAAVRNAGCINRSLGGSTTDCT